MANEFIFDNFEGEGKFPLKDAESGKIEKGLKRLLFIALVALIAEFIWLFGITPCIPLSTVEVKGFPGFDRVAVLECAGIGEKDSFVSVNAQAAEQRLLANHLVESARVVKRFPDRLSIYLEPRTAVGFSLALIGGRQVPVYFDRHGVVFKIGTAAGEIPNNLPVISGLVFTDPVPGIRLPDVLVPFLHELAGIGERAPVLLDAVSEIKINRRPYGGFDLALYLRHNPTRVLLGSSISEEALLDALFRLEALKAQSIQPAEIDIRSFVSPYSVKEVSSD